MHDTTCTEPTRFSALRGVVLAGCVLLLQACGGGSDSSTPASTLPAVTAVSAVPSYGRLSTFTVTGANLATGVTFSATGCDGLAVGAGGSSTQQTFTCTPNSALSVRVGATASGAEFYNSTFTVPKPRVTMTTTLGVIVVELEPAKVKVTVDNFLAYTKSGFYNGTIFHRVFKDFVSQGGGFTGVAGGTLTPQTGVLAPIALEINRGLSNLRGSIAMASTSAPNTATSQFFFNQVDNTFLDSPTISPPGPGYAVFGSIVSGLSVIDAMNGVSTQTVGSFELVPVIDIVVQSVVQTL